MEIVTVEVNVKDLFNFIHNSFSDKYGGLSTCVQSDREFTLQCANLVFKEYVFDDVGLTMSEAVEKNIVLIPTIKNIVKLTKNISIELFLPVLSFKYVSHVDNDIVFPVIMRHRGKYVVKAVVYVYKPVITSSDQEINVVVKALSHSIYAQFLKYSLLRENIVQYLRKLVKKILDVDDFEIDVDIHKVINDYKDFKYVRNTLKKIVEHVKKDRQGKVLIEPSVEAQVIYVDEGVIDKLKKIVDFCDVPSINYCFIGSRLPTNLYCIYVKRYVVDIRKLIPSTLIYILRPQSLDDDYNDVLHYKKLKQWIERILNELEHLVLTKLENVDYVLSNELENKREVTLILSLNETT